MLTLFRCNGRKYAFDTAAGTLTVLSALEYRMLEAITPPMEPVCPTALRYELAKYSSDAVEEAYDNLYEKAANGVIFAPETGTVRLPDCDEELLRAALAAAKESQGDQTERISEKQT